MNVCSRFPVLYQESLNTVLVQEVIRYNRLLTEIHYTLQELLRALKGVVVMSAALEAMSTSLFTNLVPSIWAGKAYPSLKPLGKYQQGLPLAKNTR
jgi:dynein heavy chain, axonemal